MELLYLSADQPLQSCADLRDLPKSQSIILKTLGACPVPKVLIPSIDLSKKPCNGYDECQSKCCIIVPPPALTCGVYWLAESKIRKNGAPCPDGRQKKNGTSPLWPCIIGLCDGMCCEPQPPKVSIYPACIARSVTALGLQLGQPRWSSVLIVCVMCCHAPRTRWTALSCPDTPPRLAQLVRS